MKFLKASIVILFLVSLATAGITFFLANIRENEKEKRIYLEEVKTDLEERLAKVESEKGVLSDQIVTLEAANKNLKKKLQEEMDAHRQVLTLLNEKDSDMEGLRQTSEEAQRAFADAQKRNKELEKILDELESRVNQIESQKIVPKTEVGYIELNPADVQPPATEPALPEVKEEPKSVSFTPVTDLPAPPKKRKFLSFLRSTETKKEEVPVDTTSGPVTPTPTVSTPPTTKPPAPKMSAPAEKIEEKVEPVPAAQKATQSIAAGSVLLINRDYNFVVVNLGSRHGLALNNVLSIERENQGIAKARVEKLYDDYSAAYIIEEQSEQPIAEGDTVTAAS